jgi:leucyl-tRNA synthetase
MVEEKIDFAKIEKKWQNAWEKNKVFEAKEGLKKKKYYVLEMFPYPSAAGLHMGHAFNFVIGDVYSRFKLMNGFNVLHPMGFDSLGLPAENAAIKEKKHPEDYTNNSIKNFTKQQKTLGLTYDWDRQVNTADPSYYKWDQWIFLKMFEKGLVYQKEAAVNWCSKCDTILANEQVVNGKCWRHSDTEVEIKQMKQWFIKITDYADRLLEGHKKLNWPEKTIAMQKNWIGKSFGTEIDFEINGDISNKEFVFLHAYGDTMENAFWQWLKKEIQARGGRVVFSKDLPNTNNPKYEEQSAFVLKNYKFNEKSVVIGHSLGNILIMKLLSSGKIKINKLIMVAPPLPTKEGIISGKAFIDNKSRPALAEYCDWEFNFNNIKESVKDISVLGDLKDHIVPIYQPKEIAEKLNGKFVEAIGNKTHFNGEIEKDVLNLLFNKWPIFTTRPDTIFGVTFMVVSSQHKRLWDLVTPKQKPAVEKFLKKLKSVSEKELAEMEKEGVFTGSYAINPANGEKVPVYAGNFVVADYGAGMVMAVPAHDQRDFEFAKKYKIDIKQVIAPLVETIEGPDAIRKDLPMNKRETVVCIVKHWKEDKYLCLDWKKQGWRTFVVGGIEKGEDKIKAGMREIKEETGYQNIRFVKEIDGEFHNRFFATHKNENRWAIIKGLYFELKDSKQKEISKEEIELYNRVWVDKEKVLSFLHDDESDKILWKRLNEIDEAYTSEGLLINSEQFNGINDEEAKEKISDWLISKKLARKTINYKLRDWSVARQRYWGTPIPLIHCSKCGVVPVPEKDLPVELPKEVKFGEGNPLLTNKKWLETKCPKCNGKATREVNTMDTFVNSSWYFLRYCDPKNDKEIFDKSKAKYWMPVDLYIGGAEHACMHLIYCRFYTMFLQDIGLVDFDEPAPRLFHQGMINDEKGEKMSKSKRNVVEPLETMAKYGVDTTRFFIMSEASPDKGFNWSDAAIQGSLRIINKIWSISQNIKFGKDSQELLVKLNNSIKNITQQIENIDYRKSTIELRELFDLISKQPEISKETFGKALRLLSPFCPHIAEELWEKIGMNKSGKDFISTAEWPKSEEVKQKVGKEDLNDKIIANTRPLLEKLSQTQKIKKVYLYVMPFEIKLVDKKKIEKLLGYPTEIFAVNDTKKYDPEQRAKKAIPGKPGIFVE